MTYSEKYILPLNPVSRRTRTRVCGLFCMMHIIVPTLSVDTVASSYKTNGNRHFPNYFLSSKILPIMANNALGSTLATELL
jgi:hypothetical protein